jgi:hypothetical protein
MFRITIPLTGSIEIELENEEVNRVAGEPVYTTQLLTRYADEIIQAAVEKLERDGYDGAYLEPNERLDMFTVDMFGEVTTIIGDKAELIRIDTIGWDESTPSIQYRIAHLPLWVEQFDLDKKNWRPCSPFEVRVILNQSTDDPIRHWLEHHAPISTWRDRIAHVLMQGRGK